MTTNYNDTLNLPKTNFPMRANLPQNEPGILEYWEQIGLYKKVMQQNCNKASYVLHDGPPYANGDIHLGHALNKVLKDIVVKYKNMTGFRAPFIPGWDTHGLPTEIKARSKFGVDKSRSMSDIDIRSLCKEFALGYIDKQRVGFKRLGVMGDWQNPYVTLKPSYEAEQVRVFAEMADKQGTIYRGLRPVYWCPSCETALAEAEIEYQNDVCHSIYVKFRIADDKGKLAKFGIDISNTYFVIWTTTAWTLPGNVAVCVGADFRYSIIEHGNEFLIMADALKDQVTEMAGIKNYKVVAEILGSELELMETYHPFLDRRSLVIVGDHVTVESGTGCVHTAPGHGVDDFEVCKNYNELPVLVPVDSKGFLTVEAGDFKGLEIHKASEAICEYLEKMGALFATKCISHQYPHCWRCKSEIIFRATKQWFCSVENFKKEALDAVENISWNPTWGKERMISMIRERKDWCISRQRIWGVPIPIFFCNHCNKELIDKNVMLYIADIFEREGSDSWYINDSSYFLPDNIKCSNCGSCDFRKETDIMDVWFDSGTSHAAVCDARTELESPADLYLEGADQYRGWFQSSLLTSIASKGVAPYKNIVTHGWVVDEAGKKQSKSQNNGVDPDKIVKQYGADILRLWVSSADYHADVRISDTILKQLSESYRKIRNTARFILGNIYDFNPNEDMVDMNLISDLDKWALFRLNELIDKVESGYSSFEFYNVYHAIQKFCIVDMSNFYLDILKDRLYVEKADSLIRRSAQTTMYIILDALVKMLAPIISYTAEEIWKYIPHLSSENTESVFLNDMSKKNFLNLPEDFIVRWNKIHTIADAIKKVLEVQRKNKIIGSSLEAVIEFYCSDDMFDFISNNKESFKSVLIVSDINIKYEGKGEHAVDGFENLSITISHCKYGKCERCWNYSKSVGESTKYPTVCQRCADILG